jgi:hypothetical protein
MDRQRYAILVMSLVLGIGGTGMAGLIAFDPRTAEVAPEDIPNRTRPRPIQKKAKTDGKNSTGSKVAPSPQPEKKQPEGVSKKG